MPIDTSDGALKAKVTFCVQGILSPILSNVVLDELDQELARWGLRFVRYADDCNIFVGSRRAGERVMASISTFLEQRMRFRVNAEKSAVRMLGEGLFLGFCFRRSSETDDHFEVGRLEEGGETAGGNHQRKQLINTPNQYLIPHPPAHNHALGE